MLGSKRRNLAVGAAILLSVALAWAATTLQAPVTIVSDQYRVPTIRAESELDAIYALGYVHARDRFFQMDFQRRAFAGRAAEMFGPTALAQDIQLRTLGLGRAAAASLPEQTPEVLAWLEAYSDGVNAYIGEEIWACPEDDECGDATGCVATQLVNPLPPEYAALELDRASIPPWTPLDSLTVVKGLAFNLSFDLEDIDRTVALLTFIAAEPLANAVGLTFNAFQYWSADLYPAVPFDPTISIPSQQVFNGGDDDPVAQDHPAANDLGDDDPGSTHFGQKHTATAAADPQDIALPEYLQTPGLAGNLQAYRDTIAEIPMLAGTVERDYTDQGSNWFIASGALTDTGFPLIANDPHLALGTPATFYEAHLQVDGEINVTGVTFPGAPGVVIGCTDIFCWGATVNSLDVTDVYQEVLLDLNPAIPGPDHTFRADGPPEPIVFIPETYLFNNLNGVVGDPLIDAALAGVLPPGTPTTTLVIPRLNNGPIVQVAPDPTAPAPQFGTGFAVAYTGWGPTRELEAFRQFFRAQSPQDFADALQFFDVGSQNWAYADINGNIAYFTSAEAPLREDLSTFPFFPQGSTVPQPPFLLRDGTHTLAHDWLPLSTPQTGQALDFDLPFPPGAKCCEILPFAEMPQIVNPPEGYIVNANNDPIGTTLDGIPWDEWRQGIPFAFGRLYLGAGYASGFRQGRIQREFDENLNAGIPFTAKRFKEIQANNQLLDAEVFVPYLISAFENALVSDSAALQALADDPGIFEAIGRLQEWDFSTPTGIIEGYDPFDGQDDEGNDEEDDESDDWQVAAPGTQASSGVGGMSFGQTFPDDPGENSGGGDGGGGTGPVLPAPSQEEIRNSVAATIYSVWRGQFVQRIVDQPLIDLSDAIAPVVAALGLDPLRLEDNVPGSAQSMVVVRRILESYPVSGGAGLSGFDFFTEPGAGSGFFDERDLAILRSLEDALALLASNEFAPAFANSTNQQDYRWGKLHRIVFAHPLGGPFDIPAAGDPRNLAPDLPGFSRAGGFGAVDASAHGARADGLNEFMFGSGPSRRVVATMFPSGPKVEEVIPGGESGIIGSPQQTDQLDLWLVNDFKPLPVSVGDVFATAQSCQQLVPAPPGGAAEQSGVDAMGNQLPGAGVGLQERDGTDRRVAPGDRAPRRTIIPRRR